MRQIQQTARLVGFGFLGETVPLDQEFLFWEHQEVQDGLSLPNSLQEVTVLPASGAKTRFHSVTQLVAEG